MKSNKTVNLKQREIIIDTNGSNLKKISRKQYLNIYTCRPPSVKMRRKLQLVMAATQPVPSATALTSSSSNRIDH